MTMAVCSRTRPAVVGRMRNHSGPYGISFDVTNGVPEMRLVQNAGKRPLLPKMSDELVLEVKALRVSSMDSMEDSMNRIGPLGNRHKMNVVGHHAVRHNGQVKFATPVAEQLNVFQPVCFVSKDIKTPSAPLRDMVWHSRHNNARGSWHDNMGVRRPERYRR